MANTFVSADVELTSSQASAVAALAAGTSVQDLIRRAYANRPGQRVPPAGASGADASLDALPVPVIILTGQSLSTGTNSAPPLSTSQWGGCRMLNADNTALVPLVEPAKGAQANNVESPAWGIGAGFECETGQSPIVINVGVGGTLTSQISKGTDSYNNAIAQVTAAKSLVGARGIEVVGVVLINGETDAVNGTEAGYLAAVPQLQVDYDTDLRAITGQNFPIPMILAQMANHTIWSVEPTSARVQCNLARTQPDRFVIGAAGYADVNVAVGDAHLNNRSSRRRGELLGSAAGRRYLRTHGIDVPDRGWKINTVTRSGSLVRVVVDEPKTTVLDTVLCDLRENYGFEWYDAGDGNSVSISSVKLSAPNTIEIQLSNTPTGTNQRIRYAYTGTGGADPGPHVSGSARGNWRSASGPISAANDSGDDATIGRELLDWCPMFDLPIETVTTVDEKEKTVTATSTVAEVDVPIVVQASQGLTVSIRTKRTTGGSWAHLRLNGVEATCVARRVLGDINLTNGDLCLIHASQKGGAEVTIWPANADNVRPYTVLMWSDLAAYCGYVFGMLSATDLTSVGIQNSDGTAVIAAGTSVRARVAP